MHCSQVPFPGALPRPVRSPDPGFSSAVYSLPGLCALSINHSNSYVAYPGSLTTGEIVLYDGHSLVRWRPACLALWSVAGDQLCPVGPGAEVEATLGRGVAAAAAVGHGGEGDDICPRAVSQHSQEAASQKAPG